MGAEFERTTSKYSGPSELRGAPLPGPIRSEMERAFNTSFADVRIHQDTDPARFDAEAFTRGSDVFLRRGSLGGDSISGRATIAHELTHVLQHRAGRVALTGSSGTSINASPLLENEAESVADRVAAGLPAGTDLGRLPPAATPATGPPPIQLRGRALAFLQERKRDSAHATYRAAVSKDGTREHSTGVAKRQARVGDVVPESAINLDLEGADAAEGALLTQNPRMLARQVTSWKVAKLAGFAGLHARERYATDITPERPAGGDLVGVSETVEGGRSIRDLADTDPDQLTFRLQDPNVQRQLSTLQMMDAITGQTDRHMGNVMMDGGNNVRGIDNDQAFPGRNSVGTLMRNTAQSFTFGERNRAVAFNQELIDHEAAKRVLKLSPKDLRNAFVKGSHQDENLNDDELAAAVDRLEMVQAHVRALKHAKRLVGQKGSNLQWGADTFGMAMAHGKSEYKGVGRNNIYQAMKEIDEARVLAQEHATAEAAALYRPHKPLPHPPVALPREPWSPAQAGPRPDAMRAMFRARVRPIILDADGRPPKDKEEDKEDDE